MHHPTDTSRGALVGMRNSSMGPQNGWMERKKEGRKEMFYLTTHSTHFIYGYMAPDIWLRTILIVRERNVLFNDALNTFYWRLYGVGHVVKNHFRKPTPATWATPSDYQQRFFYMHHPTDRIAHTTAFVTPVVKHWLEREIAQWVRHKGSIRRSIAPWANALTT